jgi:hypothetical protein
MTPFPTLCLDHNNQALTKRFAYQRTKINIWVLPKPKSQTTRLKYVNGVMTSRIGRHYQPTLWDALKACACPHKLTLFASSFGSRFFLTPKWEFDFDLGLRIEVPIVPCQLWHPFFALIHYFRDTISWKFLAFISLATWCGTFYVTLYRTKRKAMSSSRSTSLLYRSSVEFFYGFLGMFHVRFIHPRCLYWMVSFPLN